MKRSNLLWRWLSLGLVLALMGCGVEPSGSAGAGEQAGHLLARACIYQASNSGLGYQKTRDIH